MIVKQAPCLRSFLMKGLFFIYVGSPLVRTFAHSMGEVRQTTRTCCCLLPYQCASSRLPRLLSLNPRVAVQCSWVRSCPVRFGSVLSRLCPGSDPDVLGTTATTSPACSGGLCGCAEGGGFIGCGRARCWNREWMSGTTRHRMKNAHTRFCPHLVKQTEKWTRFHYRCSSASALGSAGSVWLISSSPSVVAPKAQEPRAAWRCSRA